MQFSTAFTRALIAVHAHLLWYVHKAETASLIMDGKTDCFYRVLTRMWGLPAYPPLEVLHTIDFPDVYHQGHALHIS